MSTEPSKPFTFVAPEGEPLTVETAVYQAIGAASVCWVPMDGTGVFDDVKARAIAEALLAVVRDQRVSA